MDLSAVEDIIGFNETDNGGIVVDVGASTAGYDKIGFIDKDKVLFCGIDAKSIICFLQCLKKWVFMNLFTLDSFLLYFAKRERMTAIVFVRSKKLIIIVAELD